METFTDNKIKGLKPKLKRYSVLERDGFYVRVEPSGKKFFYSKWKDQGRERTKTHGAYPAMSLADAREEHRQITSARHRGEDPLSCSEYNVNRLAKEFIEDYSKPKKKTWEEDKRILERDVLPHIGHKLIDDVLPRDVVVVCKKITKRGAPRAANVTYGIIRKMFAWAVGEGLLDSTPCATLIPQGSTSNPKDRHLQDEEIKVAWKVIGDRLDPSTYSILRLILATAQRPGECRQIRWEEIDDRWWTIPADKSKNGKEHRVYLNDLAMELLGEQKKKGFVFPSPWAKKAKEPLDSGSLPRAVRRLRKETNEDGEPTLYVIKDKTKVPMAAFTPHDLRRTAATLLGGLGWKNPDIAKLLNHVEQSVTAIYNKHEYDLEKQQMSETLDRKLREILYGTAYDSNVIPISRK